MARRTARTASNSRPSGRSRSPRRPRRRDVKLAFEALTIEGVLLSPEWLARVAALEAGTQSEADYRIPKGLQLRDEIGRYWRIAQAYWNDFSAGSASISRPHAAQALAESFILSLLRESFGFGSIVRTETSVIADRKYPIGFTAVGGHVPVVIAPARMGLDTLDPVFGDGGRRRSAFGLAQEYLNAADATWGLVTDGLALRIVRDNASLTRPAWIEADLERIFKEERYSDFAALWLLTHETRFGRPDQPSTECILEAWRTAGREEGTRARERLRDGVEETLIALGQGFLDHPENHALRTALQEGGLSPMAYFQELLRLVYRLIFLLTVEERNLLHPEGAPEAARRLYAEGYSLRGLRDRSIRRSAHDRFGDLWEAVKIVFRGLAAGEPRLAVPALAGLFARSQCPTLDAAKLENRTLLLSIFRLSWLRETSGLARVNWRDMGPEELGSVYESLLELVPQITQGGHFFAFAAGGETKGNARKTSGSYYTHDSLVQLLLDRALEPVVASTLAANPERPVEALLELSIVDPACGSGHFLLSAARRLAGHVARFQANGTPSATEYRHALRQVVSRCLYGVDLNPMAVELCKVSLWMEAVEPGLPLTFLNAHIRHGNALLGATPELMTDGIPNEAWSPIEGDDRKIASGLSKRNKNAAGGQRALATLWTKPSESETDAVVRAVAEFEAVPDADVETLTRKEAHWEGILDSDAYRHQKLVADTWCAAFMWPKQPGPLADVAPTNDLWLQIRDRQGQPPPLLLSTTADLAKQYRFFHWNLAFPQVFARGGFDVVLGNPPWDEVQFEETSWFASRDPEVSLALNASQRAERIEELSRSNPALYSLYCAAVREIEGTKHFVRQSGHYPKGASGKINTYVLFVERNAALVEPLRGAIGCVVPTGIATDKATAALFEQLMSSGQLRSLFDFVNEKRLFPAVRPHQHFCLLHLGSVRRPETSAEIASFLRDATELKDLDRRYTLSWEEVAALNPEARTLSLFPTKRHADVTRRIVIAFPPLGRQIGPTDWRTAYQQGTFNTASASGLFKPEAKLRDAGFDIVGLLAHKEDERYVPLFDAKLARQYEWRAASLHFSGNQFRKVGKAETPQAMLDDPYCLPTFAYWVPEGEANARLGYWQRKWILGFKDVTGVTSTRLAAFALIPRIGVGDKFPLLKGRGTAREHAFLMGWLNSLMVEFFLRQRMQGASLTWHLLAQVPVPTRDQTTLPCPWDDQLTVAEWVAIRAAELAVTSWPLVDFLRDLGLPERPFRYDAERRLALRAEIDAALFVLAGFSTLDVEFILGFLAKIKRRDEQLYGEYRTRTLVLPIVAALEQASLTGQRYITSIAPPPADPRVAHPPRTSVVVSLPSRPFTLPTWDHELFDEVAKRAQVRLEAEAWGTNLSGADLGMAALAAVLRNLPGPRAREDVERAVVLALLPRLMLSNFDNASAKTWRSVIGRENLEVASVGAFGIPWNAVIRRAIQQNVLAVETNEWWCAGPDVADAPSPEFDARTLVVLAWLATAPAENAEVTKQREDLNAA